MMLAFTTERAAEVKGAWAIQDGPPGRLHLTLYSTGGGIAGTAILFDPHVFRGLTAGQITSPFRTTTRFEIVGEAGTLVCEGYFDLGVGTGTFEFHAGPRLLRQVAGKFLDEDDLLSIALCDVQRLSMASLKVSAASGQVSRASL